jgi:histidine triad (HIT) family protein
MPSIFTKIISGEIPCHKIAENEHFIAFLDVFPVVRGHVLVVPKVEIDKIFEVPDDILAAALPFAKPIVKAIEKTFPCNRVGISVIGLEVPHAHIHLLPISSLRDMDFSRKLSPAPSKEELAAMAADIIANMAV